MDDKNYILLDHKLDLILSKLNNEPEEISQVKVNELDNLIEKMKRYKLESIDPNYTASLDKSLQEAYDMKNKIKELDLKIERNYKIYLDNKKLIETNKAYRQPIQQKPQTAMDLVNEGSASFAIDIQKDKEKIQRNVQRKQEKQKQRQTQMEYKIGGELFGFLGAILILVSMISLGSTLLPAFLQGITLFFIPIMFLGIAEFFERKYSEKFAKILAGIGVATGYIAVLINYLYMNTISDWIALLLSIGITLGSLVLCKIKRNSVIKIISLLGFYISLIPMCEVTNTTQIVILSACLLFISIIDMFIKTEEYKAYNYLSSILNFIGAITVALVLDDFRWGMNPSNQLLDPIIITLILTSSYAIFFKATKNRKFNIFSSVLLWLETIILALNFGELDFAFIGFLAVPLIFYFLDQKEENQWVYLSPTTICFIPIMIQVSEELLTTKNIAAVQLLIAFLAFIGYCALFQKNQNKISKLHTTVALFAFTCAGIGFEGFYAIPFMVIGLLVFMAFENYREFSTFYMIPFLTIFSVKILENTNISEEIILICSFELFITIFAIIFTQIKSMITEKSNVALTGLLVFSIIGYLMNLGNFDEHILPWVITAASTLTVLSLCNTENTKIYNFDIHRLKIYAIVATLLILIIPKAPDVLISILTIVLAVGSIYIGFIKLDKGLRTYGLGLSLIMIIKLMLFDFSADSDIGKVVLFLIGGILILSVSFLYIQLDKKKLDK